jgi:nucleosome binding factor SPN SPT16 subunit
MVLSVAVRYSGYAASVTRTFLVDPSKSFLRSYLHMVEVNNAVHAAMKPGATFESVQQAALAEIEKKPRLIEHYGADVGFLTGLEFRDKLGLLSEKSGERKLEAGMTFQTSIGLEDVKEQKQKFSMWLTDTVLVQEGGATVLTGEQGKTMKHMTYFLDTEQYTNPGVYASDDEGGGKKKKVASLDKSQVIDARLRPRDQRDKDQAEQRDVEVRQNELREKKRDDVKARFEAARLAAPLRARRRRSTRITPRTPARTRCRTSASPRRWTRAQSACSCP